MVQAIFSQAKKWVCFTAFSLGLMLSAQPLACDTDSDCGVGATCIKREKRARGVCYGRPSKQQLEAPQAPADVAPLSEERRQTGEAWLGDPESNIKQQLPGAETGAACMLNSDCPSGSECVIAGFEGRCVTLP